MSLRYQLRRELGSASSKAALGVVVSGGGAGFPLGGGGGASQVMMGFGGVLAGATSEGCSAETPSSWP